MKKPSQELISHIVQLALSEDVGTGDATTLAIVPDTATTTAYFTTRQECVFCGADIIRTVFKALDKHIDITFQVKEGDYCLAGTRIATVTGAARAILTGERTALNFIQRLSGIATLSRRYVKILGTTETKLLDTRKTTPGLRYLEKYAVAVGGATNHRMGLYDMVMIKDNHRAFAAQGHISIPEAVQLCRQKYPDLKVEVEADDMDDIHAALEAKADVIMLDNMTDFEMAEALKVIDHQAKTEASGGITLERLPGLAKLGLDFISVGALTHSAPSIDIGLDM